jgi:hypothetical protein
VEKTIDYKGWRRLFLILTTAFSVWPIIVCLSVSLTVRV